MVSRNKADASVIGLTNVRYDPGRFNGLGSPELNHRVIFVSAMSASDKVPDLSERKLVRGVQGVTAGRVAAPVALFRTHRCGWLKNRKSGGGWSLRVGIRRPSPLK